MFGPSTGFEVIGPGRQGIRIANTIFRFIGRAPTSINTIPHDISHSRQRHFCREFNHDS